MNITDLIFISLCIFLVVTMVVYIYTAEIHKKDIKNLCLNNSKRFCYCYEENLKEGKNVLEKNSS
jgi:hypothetical protein